MDIKNVITGFSGNQIQLIFDKKSFYIRKYGSILRNIEQHKILLDQKINLPHIRLVGENFYDMDYIQGINMLQFISAYGVYGIFDFVNQTVEKIKKPIGIKNYNSTYVSKLSGIDFTNICFSKKDLIEKLPQELPQTVYHGDFTFDNMIFSIEENKFYTIDPLTSEYDSFCFDLAKLMQDVKCGWFIRNMNVSLNADLNLLYENLLQKYEFLHNNFLIILMMLRILPYCKLQKDYNFIIKCVNELWI